MRGKWKSTAVESEWAMRGDSQRTSRQERKVATWYVTKVGMSSSHREGLTMCSARAPYYHQFWLY